MASHKFSNWVKNFGKSTKYSAVNILENIAPNTISGVKTTKDSVDDLRKSIINSRSNSRMYEAELGKTTLKKKAKAEFDKGMDAIKTGNISIRNNQRKSSGIPGMGDLDDMMNVDLELPSLDDEAFDLDGALSDDGGGTSVFAPKFTANIQTNNGKLVEAFAIGTETQAKVTMQSAQVISTELNNTLMSGFIKINESMMQTNQFLENIDSNIQNLIEFNNDNTSTTNQAMMDFMTKAGDFIDVLQNERQRGEYDETLDKRRTRNGQDLLNSPLDIREFVKHGKKNIVEQIDTYKIIASMALGLGDGKSLVERGFEQLVLKALMPASVQRNLQKLDNTLPSLMQSLLIQVGDWASDPNAGMFKSLFGDLFGVKSSGVRRIEMGEYDRGATSWDGESKKTLEFVIPSQLSTIIKLLSNGQIDEVYDKDRGIFRSRESIKKAYDKKIGEKISENSYELLEGFTRAMNNTLADAELSDDAKERLSGTLEDAFSSLITNNIANNSKVRVGKEEDVSRFLEGVIAPEDIQTLNQVIKAMSVRDLARINTTVNAARNDLEEMRYGIQKGNLGYSKYAYLFDHGERSDRYEKSRITSRNLFQSAADERARMEELAKTDPEIAKALQQEKWQRALAERRGMNNSEFEELDPALAQSRNPLYRAFYHINNGAVSAVDTIGNRVVGRTEEREFDPNSFTGKLKTRASMLALDLLVKVFGGDVPPDVEEALNLEGENIIGSGAPDLSNVVPRNINGTTQNTHGTTTMVNNTQTVNQTEQSAAQETTNLLNELGESDDEEPSTMEEAIIQGQQVQNKSFKGLVFGLYSTFLKPQYEKIFGKDGLISNIYNSERFKEFRKKTSEFLFGVKGEDKVYRDGIFSGFTNSFLDGVDYLKYAFTGEAYTNRQGESFAQKEDSVWSRLKTGFSDLYQNTMRYLFGYNEENPDMYKDNPMYQKTFKRVEDFLHEVMNKNKVPGEEEAELVEGEESTETTPEVSGASTVAQEWINPSMRSEEAEPVQPTEPVDTETTTAEVVEESEPLVQEVAREAGAQLVDQVRNVGARFEQVFMGDSEKDETQKGFMKSFKASMPKILTAGVIGAALPVLSGFNPGLLGGLFLPGGPIGGAIVGIGAGMLMNSEKFQRLMFGDKDEDGNRQGGFISDELKKKFKSMLPIIAGGAAIGALKTIVTGAAGVGGTGVLAGTLLPGGILGGALLGAATGLVVRSKKFQDIVFGKEDSETGERPGTKLSETMNSIGDKLKKSGNFITSALKGGALGGVSAGVISHMGFLGGALTLGGPIGGAILGAGIGIASQTKRFQELLFGTAAETDEDGNVTARHNDGLLTRFTNLLHIRVIEPLQLSVKESVSEIAYFVRRHFVSNFILAFGPLLDFGTEIKENIQDGIHMMFTTIGEGISAVLQKAFEPFEKMIKKTSQVLFGPIKKVTTTMLKGLGLIAASPLKIMALMTQPLRNKAQKEFMNQYREERWAKSDNVMEYIFGTANEETGELEGGFFDRSSEVYKKGMQDYKLRTGIGSLGWMEEQVKRKEMRKQRKVDRKNFASERKQMETRQKFQARDKHVERALTEREFKDRINELKAAGVDTDAIQTVEDLNDYTYRNSQWRDRQLAFANADAAVEITEGDQAIIDNQTAQLEQSMELITIAREIRDVIIDTSGLEGETGNIISGEVTDADVQETLARIANPAEAPESPAAVETEEERTERLRSAMESAVNQSQKKPGFLRRLGNFFVSPIEETSPSAHEVDVEEITPEEQEGIHNTQTAVLDALRQNSQEQAEAAEEAADRERVEEGDYDGPAEEVDEEGNLIYHGPDGTEKKKMGFLGKLVTGLLEKSGLIAALIGGLATADIWMPFLEKTVIPLFKDHIIPAIGGALKTAGTFIIDKVVPEVWNGIKWLGGKVVDGLGFVVDKIGGWLGKGVKGAATAAVEAGKDVFGVGSDEDGTRTDAEGNIINSGNLSQYGMSALEYNMRNAGKGLTMGQRLTGGAFSKLGNAAGTVGRAGATIAGGGGGIIGALGRGGFRVTDAVLSHVPIVNMAWKPVSALTKVTGKTVSEIAKGAAEDIPKLQSLAHNNVVTKFIRNAKNFFKEALASDKLKQWVKKPKVITQIQNFFMGIFDDVLKNHKAFKTLSDIIATKGGKIISGGIEAVPLIGWALTAVTGVWDVATGALEAANLFGVAEADADTTMRIISSIIKFLCGFSLCGTVLDILNDFISQSMNIDFKRGIATSLYKIFAGSVEEEKLENSQNTMKEQWEAYNNEHGTNMSYDAYNDMVNQSTWSKVTSSVRGIFSKNKNESAAEVETQTTRYKYSGTMGSASAIGYGDDPGSVFSQKDKRWAKIPIGMNKDGTIATMESGGCGPTALSMAASMLDGKPTTPVEVANMATNSGYITNGGSNPKLFTEGASKLGLKTRALDDTNLSTALQDGNPVVVAGKSTRADSPYSGVGHIMTVTGLDRDGYTTLYDPRDGSTNKVNIAKIKDGLTHAWQYNKPNPEIESKGAISPLWQNSFSGRNSQLQLNQQMMAEGKLPTSSQIPLQTQTNVNPTAVSGVLTDSGSVALSNGATEKQYNGIIYYNQGDSRWKNHKLGKTDTIGNSGCVVTSLAMALSGLTGRAYTPATIMDTWGDTYFTDSGAIKWGLMNQAATDTGLMSTEVSPTDIATKLKQNIPVVLYGKKNNNVYGKSGNNHSVIALGLKGNNLVRVNDPGSESKTKTYAEKGVAFKDITNGFIRGYAFTNGGKGLSDTYSSYEVMDSSMEGTNGVSSALSGATSFLSGIMDKIKKFLDVPASILGNLFTGFLSGEGYKSVYDDAGNFVGSTSDMGAALESVLSVVTGEGTARTDILSENLDEFNESAKIPNQMWKGFGLLSQPFESSAGMTAVNKDNVGWAYGKHQYNSSTGALPDFFNMVRSENPTLFNKYFSGVQIPSENTETPSTAFNNAWKNAAGGVDAEEFERLYDKFTWNHYYQGNAMGIQAITGNRIPEEFDYPYILKEAILSTEINHGGGGTKKLMRENGVTSLSPEDQFLDKLYDARASHYSKNKGRYADEKATALQVLDRLKHPVNAETEEAAATMAGPYSTVAPFNAFNTAKTNQTFGDKVTTNLTNKTNKIKTTGLSLFEKLTGGSYGVSSSQKDLMLGQGDAIGFGDDVDMVHNINEELMKHSMIDEIMNVGMGDSYSPSMINMNNNDQFMNDLINNDRSSIDRFDFNGPMVGQGDDVSGLLNAPFNDVVSAIKGNGTTKGVEERLDRLISVIEKKEMKSTYVDNRKNVVVGKGGDTNVNNTKPVVVNKTADKRITPTLMKKFQAIASF